MKITICASLKFHDELLDLERRLKDLGHVVYMPIKVDGVDYWAKDGSARVAAKRGLGLISKHMDKIKGSNAILVANYTKRNIKNYIGANTFAEIIFASYVNKKIFLLNPIPNQSYIVDEIQSVNPILLNGDLAKVK
ncbi:MAG TPA: hypothetical protein VMR18_00445 [Candidatus Saccharimonadales bacterium]|nr:hypothetical protein [Candidatus Saccharimonadales bacterium]